MNRATLICLNFSLLLCGVYALDIPGTVTGNQLNVRTRPVRGAEVITQLAKGDKVQVVEFKNDWLGIKAPASTPGWVQKGAISNGVVKTISADVRSGPGPAFTAFAKIKKGAQVTIIQERGNWIHMKGHVVATLWVHGDYVELPPKYKRPKSAGHTRPDKKTEGGFRRNSKGEIVRVTPGIEGKIPKSTPIVPPKKMVIVELEGSAQSTEIQTFSTAKRISKIGTVVPLKKKKGRPWSYALAAQINNRFYPLLYISGSFKNVSKWAWRRVEITGDQQWVRGWSYPMVEVIDIKDATE